MGPFFWETNLLIWTAEISCVRALIRAIVYLSRSAGGDTSKNFSLTQLFPESQPYPVHNFQTKYSRDGSIQADCKTRLETSLVAAEFCLSCRPPSNLVCSNIGWPWTCTISCLCFPGLQYYPSGCGSYDTPPISLIWIWLLSSRFFRDLCGTGRIFLCGAPKTRDRPPESLQARENYHRGFATSKVARNRQGRPGRTRQTLSRLPHCNHLSQLSCRMGTEPWIWAGNRSSLGHFQSEVSFQDTSGPQIPTQDGSQRRWTAAGCEPRRAGGLPRKRMKSAWSGASTRGWWNTIWNGYFTEARIPTRVTIMDWMKMKANLQIRQSCHQRKMSSATRPRHFRWKTSPWLMDQERPLS